MEDTKSRRMADGLDTEGEESLLKCILPITKQNVFLSIPLKLHRKKDPEMQKVIINGNYVTLIMYC